MKILILFDYRFINGSFFDCLEYYIFLNKYMKDNIYLAFLNNNINKNIIKTIINNRYINIDIDNIINNIININKLDLLKDKYKIIIFDYNTLKSIYNFLGKNDILILSNINYDFVKKYNKYLNYLTLGELIYHYYNEYYEYKFLFDKYKPLDKNNIKDKILFRCFDNTNIDKYNKLNKDYIIYNNKELYINNNIYEEFTDYIYITSKDKFDQKPRMLIESKYYNKNIEYYNEYNIFDGGYYRYTWLLNNNIQLRNFNDSDRVLKWCIYTK